MALILLTPISVGIIASAYRQTVGVADTNRRLRERQFVEMRDELQTAHEMQMGLLPDQAPELDEYYLDGMSVPANNVGGDYFTYRWLDDAYTRLASVVADVSGMIILSRLLWGRCSRTVRRSLPLDGAYLFLKTILR